MDFVKNYWTKEDIDEFQEYLKNYQTKTNLDWAKNILQTEMPIIGLTTSDFKKIINELSKGNYLSFLDYMVWDYYDNTVINGGLISKIKDFDTMKKYLDIYLSRADNWATCDLLKFNVKGHEEQFFHLSNEYIKSDKPFVRRVGMYILFDLINNPLYIDKIFKMFDLFYLEEHYYVNMMNAWLLCECFIKQRDKTLQYLEHHHLNKFTINKGIQKCRDSRRVSQEDKELLLKFKILSK